MGKAKEQGYIEAELFIDETVKNIHRELITVHEAIEILKENSLVKTFFSDDDIDLIIDFETDLSIDHQDIDCIIDDEGTIH
jgi:hypothetical protein|tara:strand:+ start:196 stop:438 length:243 start_codon:yes stop_codon:yes gene_type:complete